MNDPKDWPLVRADLLLLLKVSQLILSAPKALQREQKKNKVLPTNNAEHFDVKAVKVTHF